MSITRKNNPLWVKNNFLLFLSLSTLLMLLVNIILPKGCFRNHLCPNQQSDDFISKNFNPTSAEKPDEPEVEVDKLNNGVYTNCEYGIRFEYPNTVFTNQLAVYHPENIGLIQQEWQTESMKDEFFMVIAIRYKIHKERYDYLRHSIGLKLALGEEHKSENGIIRKIGISSLNGIEGIISMTEVERLNGTTLFSYLITYDQDNILYSLSVSSNNKEKLEQHYDTFVEVVESLEIGGSEKNSCPNKN